MQVAERYFNAESCQRSETFVGSGNTPFILDEVSCDGSENSWYDCPRNADFDHDDCSASEAFGLICTGVGERQSEQSPALPIPALPVWSLGLLGMVLAAIAVRHFRRSSSASKNQ